ncbi:MAG: hypothetical protein ACREQW_03365, partial [Candidatus Binatia bacterium]
KISAKSRPRRRVIPLTSGGFSRPALNVIDDPPDCSRLYRLHERVCGSDHAKWLSFQGFLSNDASYLALEDHFWGQNHTS